MKCYHFLFITICIYSAIVSSRVLKRRRRTEGIEQSKYAKEIEAIEGVDEIYEPNFKIFEFAKKNQIKDNKILPIVLLKILEKEDLLKYFNMDVLDAFLEKVQNSYGLTHHVYYHNALHAADVVQTLYSYIHSSDFTKILKDYELVALYFAGACHDLKHPGFNNNYYQKTEKGVRKIYDFEVSQKDQHILEKMHAAIALDYLGDDVLSGLKSEEEKIKELIQKFIEETDNSKHFEHLGDLSKYGETINIAITKGTKENIEEAKIKVLSALVHAADISNPTKIFSEYQKHALACVKEFINQYLSEKANGKDLSAPFNPYTGNGLANRQIGFIRFIRSYVDTIANKFRSIENAMHIQSNMDHNLAKYLAILDKEEGAEEDISDIKIVDILKKNKKFLNKDFIFTGDQKNP